MTLISNWYAIAVLAWWGWVLALATAALAFFLLALLSWRKGVRRRLIAHLAKTKPELRVIGVTGQSILFESEAFGSGQINLHNLYNILSQSEATATDKEPEVLEKFLSGLWESLERQARPMSIEADGAHILPRLANAAHLVELRRNAPLPAIPVGETGLWIVFVRDAENAVEYVNEGKFTELGIELEELRQRAIANLKQKSPGDFVRETIDKSTLSLVKSGDTFDAARLLLVPELLSGDETLVAVVPDRDTLGLLPVPPDGNSGPLKKLAQTTAGPPLLNRPLLVTRHGFELFK